MRDPIRVLVLGAGQMGCAIVRVLLDKDGVDIVGVCDPFQQNLDVGRVCGAEGERSILAEGDLRALLLRTRPDVAIQATCSELTRAWPDIRQLLEAGVSVISIAEEMAFPYCRSTGISDEMDQLAKANGAVVLGTGINPGFVLDLLIIALSGVCTRLSSISATRINDISPYGETVLEAQGVGLTPTEFEEGVQKGTVVGHVGFPESMHLIGTALGWTFDRIEQTREPILASVPHPTPSRVIEPGRVIGCRQRAWAYRDDVPLIRLDHPQLLQPELEGMQTEDRIEIDGTPPVRLRGCPEIAGGEGTAAIAVNMIPRVLSAPPGLRTMAELPVPSAVEADMRRFVRPATVPISG